MGLCHGKHSPPPQIESAPNPSEIDYSDQPLPNPATPKAPKFPFYSPSPLPGSYKNSPANSSLGLTPLRIFKRPFPPPSSAKHIKALLSRRHGSVKLNESSIPERSEVSLGLDKSFGFSKGFAVKYELGEEVGRGYFGYTLSAKAKKGELEGEEVAVKVIPKAKIITVMEGPSRALYTLISWYAKVSLIPNEQAEDAVLSNYKLETVSPQMKRA